MSERGEPRRDYDHFVDDLRAAARQRGASLEKAGDIDGYTVHYCRLRGSASPARRILLTAGTHGDEPAGPAAILQFLALPHSPLIDSFEYLVLPCINPHGYVYGSRENSAGLDINRSFAGTFTPESALVVELLDRVSFDIVVDLHEDWEHPGYYLWEGRRRGIPELGRPIIRAVSDLGPIYAGHTLDDFPIEAGVIAAEEILVEYERAGVKSLLSYVFDDLAERGITSETPTQWQLDDRVRAHLVALDVVLTTLR